MSGVGVKQAATVCAKHLDGFLGSHRSLNDGLSSAFDSLSDGVGMKILDHALRAEEQGHQE